MQQQIHPKYYPAAKVTCAGCERSFTVGATKETIQVELCSQCHPFYTGKQKLVDTAGRVDRFRARAAKAKQAQAGQPERSRPASKSANQAPDTPEARLAAMKQTLSDKDD